MSEQQPFPKQEEHERAGGQHGLRNRGNVGPRTREADRPEQPSLDQPSPDPQLRRVHEAAQTPEPPGARGNETDVEDGGARHRQQ